MSAPTLRPVARPPVPRAAPRGGTTAALVAAAPAVLSALLVGLLGAGLPLLLVWASDARSTGDTAEAVRAAGQLWLVAHGVPLGLPAGRLSLVPLGAVLLLLGLLRRAGRQAAQRHPVADLRGAAVLTAAVAGPYALVAVLVAVLSPLGATRPSVAGALVAPGLVALVGAGSGVLRESGVSGQLLPALPSRLRPLLVPAAAAALVLVAAGALLAGAALALGTSEATDLAQAGTPGAVGGVALLVLGLALVPNAVVWATAWWAGPGFAVGTGTGVGPFAHDLGAVPSLPLLAALPAGPVPLGAGLAALLVPLLAGGLAGVLVGRAGSRRPVVDAALCGPLVGAGLGLLAWLSAGSAGARRLSEVGPSAWQVALAVTLQVAAGAALVAWVRARRRR